MTEERNKNMVRIKKTTRQDGAEELWNRGIAAAIRIICFICGFILSAARLFTMHVPLSTGFAAACPEEGFIFSVAGALAGGILRLTGGELINALVPLAGTGAVRFLLKKTGALPENRIVMPVTVFLMDFFCGTVIVFAEGLSLNAFMLCLCSACINAASVVFYSGAAGYIGSAKNAFLPDEHSLICITAGLCSLLLGSSEISLAGFRPSGAFAAFVTVGAAYLFGAGGGSIAGIVMGMGNAVGGTGAALALSLSICGLSGGIFSKFGRFSCALAFSLAAGVASLIDGTAEGIAVFAQAAAAAIVFSLIPRREITKMKKLIREPGAGRVREEFSAAGEKLKKAAYALGSVSSCVASVSEGISAMEPDSEIMVIMRVRERVCSSCRLKDTFCPECGEFAEITEKLSRGEEVSAADFSLNFNSKCPSVPRLADNFNRVYAGRKAVNALQANSARSRELACCQFDWMAELLRELSETTRQGAYYLYEKEKTAARVLRENGFEPDSVKCTVPLSGAMKLECRVREIPVGTSLSRLTSYLSGELRAELMSPEIRENKEDKELIFRRKELFGVTLGSARASCGNKKLCGDYFECFTSESSACIVLSDGMGTGGRAAIDSTMTVELFSRLVKAGLAPEISMKITNSALAVKSDDESVSTLDAAMIDLFTGEAEIYKAGAAATFRVSSGKVMTDEIASTPLGILSKVNSGKITVKLRAGDVLVMVSDGVLGSGSDWIKEEIRTAGEISDPQSFSEELLSAARRKCGEMYDDMTVITALITEN